MQVIRHRINMYKYEIIVEYLNGSPWTTKRSTAKELEKYIKAIHQAPAGVKSYTVNIIPNNLLTKGKNTNGSLS